MSKGAIAPGQRFPKGSFVDKAGKLRSPKVPPKTKVIDLRVRS
jgi:hypothetical protein